MNGNNNKQQHKTLAHALLPDLPLLMHGSGDVRPECVNPKSVAVLAQLTEKYIATLVSAAMDAHDVFTDGEVVGGGACLGPPPFSAAATNTLADGDDDDDDKIDTKRKAKHHNSAPSRQKKKQKVDYWDVPFVGGKNQDDSSTTAGDSSDDDAPIITSKRKFDKFEDKVAFGNVEGFSPLDVHVNERTRDYYVSAPTVMDARSFIFPICSDAVLYQRIKEVQASRRAIRRDVVDNVLMNVMKEEGMNEGRRGMIDLWDVASGSGNVATSSSSVIDDDGKKKAVPSSPSKKGKGNEGKSEDGSNIVGASVLGPDVDPSWPGLNSLARGKLWN